jgi:hypothetical protein
MECLRGSLGNSDKTGKVGIERRSGHWVREKKWHSRMMGDVGEEAVTVSRLVSWGGK